jgi:hypothetical protein
VPSWEPCMMTTLADCSSLRRFDIDSRTNLTVFSRSRIDSQLARGKSSHLSEIIKVHRVAGRIRVRQIPGWANTKAGAPPSADLYH